MAIAYVSGAHGSSASAAGTFTVSYAPAAGNQVVVGVAFPTTPGGTLVVKDNLGNTLAAGASQGTSPYIFTFAYPAGAPSGVTGFTATWSGSSAVAMAVAEYSGAAGVDVSVDATRHNFSNNATATLTVATLSANEFIVMATVTTTPSLTVTVGNLRQQDNTQSTVKITLQDNTAATAGNVTNTATQTAGTFWCAAALLVGGPSTARVSQDIITTVTQPSTAKARASQDIALALTSPSTAKVRVSQDVVLLIKTSGGGTIVVGGPRPQVNVT
jgi:hypothetical protein